MSTFSRLQERPSSSIMISSLQLEREKGNTMIRSITIESEWSENNPSLQEKYFSIDQVLGLNLHINVLEVKDPIEGTFMYRLGVTTV